ncbi:Dabb family protein [uncultured Ruthenibacterium sp.]|uniref:Dabb family protein n=1 Tax=uncultured Ruthenibacterium sp. TaxID=1905347 RepID=UPI00349E8404
MVKHIVFWNLSDPEHKQENAARMKELLEGLVGIVPGLVCAQVSRSFAGFDVVLESQFTDRDALDGYQNHPAHLEVKKFVHSVICERASCDFEM